VYSLLSISRVNRVLRVIRIRRKKDNYKLPSMWGRLSWIERVIMYCGPFYILWILYHIIYG